MFRLFGFDVRVRTGFVLFLALIAFIYPDGYGIWLAGAIAVFTLVHELGHAVAARSAGANASISLDFMAGYTSFSTRTPIGHARHALISVAGPATQIAASTAVLLGMGVNPVSIDSVRDAGNAGQAVWWAGPMIGLINLIPVLPLDGGHLAQTGIEAVLRRPAQREMAVASVAITVATAVALAVLGHTGFVIFVAFLLIGQLQILQATSRRTTARSGAAWNDDGFMQGGAPSPWQQAHQLIARGQGAAAAQAIVDDLAADAHDSSESPRWQPPYDAPIEALAAIAQVLPHPLPDGNAWSTRVLCEVLIATGRSREGGELAAAGFHRHRTPMLALMVARAAAQMGDQANAMQWVRAAIDATGHRPPYERALVAKVLDAAPELQALRAEPTYQASRANLG
jgi:Zn-dependent protease